jgi:hypothetical protein
MASSSAAADAVHQLSEDSEWLCNWARTSSEELIRTCADKLEHSQCNTSVILQPTGFEDLTECVDLTRLQARAVIAGLKKEASERTRMAASPLGCFWDVENISLPSSTAAKPTDVIERLRSAIQRHGAVKAINIYAQVLNPPDWAPFTARGCHLVATPQPKQRACAVCTKKEVADQAITTDLLLFAWHHRPPATVVLISDDSDFSKVLTRLHDLGYRVILIHQKDNVRDSLRSSADIVLHWKRDILRLPERLIEDEQKFSPPPRVLLGLSPPSSPPRAELPPPEPSAPGRRTGKAADREEVKTADDAKSVEQAPLPPAAGPYGDLVHALRQLTSQFGTSKHLRSSVGVALLTANPMIYRRPGGATTFKSYVQGAVEAGVVVIGGESGDAWVELSRQFIGESLTRVTM